MQGKWQAFNCSGRVYWEWRVRLYNLQINHILFYRYGHVLPTFARQLILAHLTVAEWVVETLVYIHWFCLVCLFKTVQVLEYWE